MFSERLKQYAEKAFESRKEYYAPILSELEEQLLACSEQEAVLARFLYGTMPARDAGEYDFSIFLDYIRHAIYLREHVEWCKELPEDVFVNYVLYARINSEDISPCRSFFYEQLKDRIAGMSLREAIIEVNYWCAEHATYETTDGRTASPMTLYRCGKGRCGEESTFAVSAFRSVGIAARQVYTPRWAHCDDNHAWVEVYVDKEWHFLGACEPQEVLDMGWFSGPANRAILIHARNFSDYTSEDGEEQIGKEGSLYYYNNTAFYAKTRKMNFTVTDAQGNPIEQARIGIELLNMAEFFPVATLVTDVQGKASLTLGIGDLYLRVWKDDVVLEQLVKIGDGADVTIVLSKENSEFGKPDNTWHFVDMEAPKEEPVRDVSETKEQKENNTRRLKEAEQMRKERLEAFYDEEKAAAYVEEQEMLHRAGENFDEIYKFLSKDDNPNRKKLLHSLAVKDAKDAKADILEDYLACEQNGLDDEIFEKYVLCPRVAVEELTRFKSYIRNYFDKETLDTFAKDPMKVYEYITEHIAYNKNAEYGTILGTPVGVLRLGQGSKFAQYVLFVAICRTVGVPARLNPVTRIPEYYADGVFCPVIKEDAEKKNQKYGTLVLSAEDPDHWKYYQTWTLGKLKGDHFATLNFEEHAFDWEHAEVKLETGIYRIVTTLRLPNGNQQISLCTFEITEGAKTEVTLKKTEHDVQEHLLEEALPDMKLTDVDGVSESMLSELCVEKPVLLAFLGVGGEPTEHVLNELCDISDKWNEKQASVFGILKDRSDAENVTLKKAKDKVQGMKLFLAQQEDREAYAKIMSLDAEKLPLLVLVLPGLKGAKAYAGYNVGSVALMLRLMQEAEK